MFDAMMPGEFAHQYIADYIATEAGNIYPIHESGQSVYIGRELTGEFTQSRYTKQILKSRPDFMNAKNQSVQNLGEIINIAKDRRWEKNKKQKHNNDAKYGFYYYTSRIGIPKNNSRVQLYTVTLVIRNDANGKKYLYDITEIKKAGSAKLSPTGHMRGKTPPVATASPGSRLAQSKGDVNANQNISPDDSVALQLM